MRSKLEYGCQVWDPFKIREIDTIEHVQRYFTSKFRHFKDFNYWERLEKLGIMSLQRRREKLTLLLVWKIKYGGVPNVINLNFVNTNTRSGTKALVRPMPRVNGSLLTLFENCFAVKAAKLWNKLPSNLQNTVSLHMFKQKLDLFLNLFPDKPPVRGYYHVNSNSLLDYNNINPG